MSIRTVIAFCAAILLQVVPGKADEPALVRPVVPQGEPSDSLSFNSTFFPSARVVIEPPDRAGLRRIRVQGCSSEEIVSEQFYSLPKVLIAYELGDDEQLESCRIDVIVHFVKLRPNIGLSDMQTQSVQAVVFNGRMHLGYARTR